jgi:hypothetical protein
MSLATQFAGAIECAQFHELNDLSAKLWKAHAAGHLTDDEAQELAEQIEAKRPKRRHAHDFSFRPIHAEPKPKKQRSPDKQASIERRRKLARQSPVPPQHTHEFTQGQHAAITVVVGEIRRVGFCDWCIAKIGAVAGVCETLVRTAMHKGRELGLLSSEQRPRKGQKSLTNIVRIMNRAWAGWLKRWMTGYRKTESTTCEYKNSRAATAGDGSGDKSNGMGRWKDCIREA